MPRISPISTQPISAGIRLDRWVWSSRAAAWTDEVRLWGKSSGTLELPPSTHTNYLFYNVTPPYTCPRTGVNAMAWACSEQDYVQMADLRSHNGRRHPFL
jgi:hypothetical protein